MDITNQRVRIPMSEISEGIEYATENTLFSKIDVITVIENLKKEHNQYDYGNIINVITNIKNISDKFTGQPNIINLIKQKLLSSVHVKKFLFEQTICNIQKKNKYSDIVYYKNHYDKHLDFINILDTVNGV